MSRNPTSLLVGSRARSVAIAPLLVACIGVLGCGSSSNTTNTAADAAAKTTVSPAATTSTGTSGSAATRGTSGGAAGKASTAPGSLPSGTGYATGSALASRIAAMRNCLSKNGVTVPQRGGAGSFVAPPQLPKGMTRTRYAELLRQCGAGTGLAAGARAGGFRQRFANPAFRQALTAFATCLRQNGVNIPAPNTSGHGPIFNGKGLDVTSPKFREARRKCRSTLVATLRSRTHGRGAAG